MKICRINSLTPKKKGDKKKNSGCNVIFVGKSLPDYNASLLPLFVLFPFQKTSIFSLFFKHYFSKKFISFHLEIFSEALIIWNSINDFITNIFSLNFMLLCSLIEISYAKKKKAIKQIYFLIVLTSVYCTGIQVTGTLYIFLC